MEKTIILSENAPEPIGPYSQPVMKNGMLFISGQIGINSATNLIDTTNIEVEAKQVMENIKFILTEKSKYPARETVEVTALPKNAHIEISVIAAK